MTSNSKKKFNFSEFEDKWRKLWSDWAIYQYDPTRPRSETFAVDTPPPTVSGDLHVGHTYSFTHQDFIVRYQRKLGKNIFYPMGWDDNGLPTERRAQRLLSISCDPSLPEEGPYDGRKGALSRRAFIAACHQITKCDEGKYQELWRKLGLSVDWSLLYTTINSDCRQAAQLSFLRLAKAGIAYQAEAPTMWDIDFQTAVAQAETEDRAKKGLLHHISFGICGGGDLTIATTRPELLPACIAIAAHPEDERYKGLFGKSAISPLFEAEIPILPSEHAAPEMGTGALMICTFGDSADVEFWKKSDLAAKPIIGRDGRLLPITWGKAPFLSLKPQLAQERYDELEGLKLEAARARIAVLLGKALLSEPITIEQRANYYEKGESPLEYITTRQWFINILDYKDKLLELGRTIEWHPTHFRKRYEHWVEGLNQDWCISRQRHFGVPLPLWYHTDEEGKPDYERPIFAKEERLPIFPMAKGPQGFGEDQKNAPNGYSPCEDVLDTWATSSLTPLIAAQWIKGDKTDNRSSIFPMDLRPQGQEIIRTWTFYTIVMSWLHKKSIPWKKILISGWVTDPANKKMSKSKGNTLSPNKLLRRYSADAMRYWAARGRPGTDKSFDEDTLKKGKRLAVKLFNAGKFLLACLKRYGQETPLDSCYIKEPLDKSFMANLRTTVQKATCAFDSLEYTDALEATETSFWQFCDNYLELVKGRAYDCPKDESKQSALATLCEALRTYLNLFSPFMPYVTEEIWSWFFARDSGQSLHKAPWPNIRDMKTSETPELFTETAKILATIRKCKTESKRSLRWPLASLSLKAPKDLLATLAAASSDLALASNTPLEALAFYIGEKLEIEVLLEESE